MATGTLRRIEEFDSTSDWDLCQTGREFFLANDIDDDEKKRAVFISIIGPSMYKTLRNLFTPAKPAEPVRRSASR